MSPDKLAAEQRDADFDWLTAHPAGRRILFRMFIECGLIHPSQAAGQLSFGEGGRAYAATWQWDILTRNPDRLALLLTENAHLVKAGRSGRRDDPDYFGADDGDGSGE